MTQILQVGNINSETLPVPYGVPQGSLLFILYINDMSYSKPSMNLNLYTDDSTIFETGYKLAQIENKLHNDLNCIQKWCKIYNMALNALKTKCMTIGSPYHLRYIQTLNLYLNGAILENVTTQQKLGVYVDNKLNWKVQTDNAYILPIIDYCCSVWRRGSNHHTNKVFSLQKRIAKIILKTSTQTHSVEHFKELKWLKFADRCKYYTAILIIQL